MLDALKWVAPAIGAILLLLFAQFLYLAAVLAWQGERTRGLGYYGLPPAERARFKARLRRHARLLSPILALVRRFSTFTFEKSSFRHEGVAAPRGTCTPESFTRAIAYAPRPEDVFIVTQMKCGTTWMQHLAYEVVMRGRGDIVDSGRTLYGVSPWIEAVNGVPIEEAPLHGEERPSRIIKTHLPVQLCPYDPAARYVYVVRHPVSCFASCVDFIRTNSGGIARDLAAIERWFCSDDMWWGPWTAHVAGWHRRAAEADGVLFVRFEDMRRDLADVARRVAAFLGVAPLTDAELADVVRKCSFEYMKRNDHAFEMHPPHLLQTRAELFVRGTADRHRDIPADTRERIIAWCAADLERRGVPLQTLYPDAAPAGR